MVNKNEGMKRETFHLKRVEYNNKKRKKIFFPLRQNLINMVIRF